MRNACAGLAWLALCAGARAYDPPSDTAGPLTVRMQAPAVGAYGAGGFVELSRPDVPFTLPVMLQNASELEIRGTLREAARGRPQGHGTGASKSRR